jgi:hypothetical protein
MERLERLRQRLLHEILGLGAIALEPHGMAKQPVDVRHRLGFEHEPTTPRIGVSGHKVNIDGRKMISLSHGLITERPHFIPLAGTPGRESDTHLGSHLPWPLKAREPLGLAASDNASSGLSQGC